MDAFSDSGELFTIRNQFFTNQYQKVKSYSLGHFSEENRLRVLIYQVRAFVATKEDASILIDEAREKFPDNEELFQLLSAWNDLQTFGTDDSTYFDDIQEAQFEQQAVLTAIYLVKFKSDIDSAIKILDTYVNNHGSRIDEVEPFLVLSQLYLIEGKFSAASKILNDLSKLSESSRDSIIYQIIDSWISSLKGGTENISNAYYFYDEILSADFDLYPQEKSKILTILFAFTLQLKHYPEALDILAQIKDLGEDNLTSDLVANEISFDYLVNEGLNIDSLLGKLEKLDASHPLLIDFEEKESLFNDIANKYTVNA